MELEPTILSALIGAGAAGGLFLLREIVVSVRRSFEQRRERKERVHRALFLLLRLRDAAYLVHPRREKLWWASWKSAIEELMGGAFSQELEDVMRRKRDLLPEEMFLRKLAAGLSDAGDFRETLIEVAAGDPVLATALAVHLSFFNRLAAADAVADALREDEKKRGVPRATSAVESGRGVGRTAYFDDGLPILDRAIRALASRADRKVKRAVLKMLSVAPWDEAKMREDARRTALLLVPDKPSATSTKPGDR